MKPRLVLAIVTLGLLAGVTVASSEDDGRPTQGIITLQPVEPADTPLGRVSTNRVIILGQVQIGIDHASLALGALEARSFEAGLKNAQLCYYNLRWAAAGVELARDARRSRRVPDPLLEQSERAIHRAMGHVRLALNAALGAANGDNSGLPRALESLRHAITDATQAVNLL